MTRKLVLFDIDETLVHTGGAGRAALAQSVRMALNTEIELPNVQVAGKTDPAILRELLTAAGVQPEELANPLRAALDVLPSVLESIISQYSLSSCDGAHDLLIALSRTDATLGLMSGNVRACAIVKLRHADLARFFEFE